MKSDHCWCRVQETRETMTSKRSFILLHHPNRDPKVSLMIIAVIKKHIHFTHWPLNALYYLMGLFFFLRMRGTRALCGSTIPELVWGGLSAGRNAVCTSWGGWRDGRGAGEAFWHPPEAMAGNGDAGKRWRGQQHPHACGRWSQARGISLSGLCTPKAASLRARIALHCLGQVRHWAFLPLPSRPLSAFPAPPSPPVLLGDKAVPWWPPPPLPRVAPGLSGRSVGEGRAQNKKNKS